ncbi:MAG: recombinase family protein [Solobacterium sp.]|nr:recombinase family protein [Solobacterium sp.]
MARTATSRFETVKDPLDRGVALHVLNMGLIDNTPAGRLILHIMLSFAEFEREMIKERTVADKAIARQKKPDYPESRPRKITSEIIEQIHAGRSWKEPEISRATWYWYPNHQSCDCFNSFDARQNFYLHV